MLFVWLDMMDKNTSLYILLNIGGQFCSVMQQEKKAITQAGEKSEWMRYHALQAVVTLRFTATFTLSLQNLRVVNNFKLWQIDLSAVTVYFPCIF